MVINNKNRSYKDSDFFLLFDIYYYIKTFDKWYIRHTYQNSIHIFLKFMIFIYESIYVMKKLTTKEFVERAKKMHGNKYDYSKVNYKNNKTKVCIICPIHGEFWQLPSFHLNGCECPKCKGKNMTTEEFCRKSRLIHGDKYDYSKVNYINNSTKVCIICPIHGEFWQTPDNHIHEHGCPFCKANKLSKIKANSIEDFIKKAKEIHGEKYDYSKVKYVNNRTKVEIICPIHGSFWQTPNSHLANRGCLKCSGKNKHTVEEFINLAKKIHGNKYDYSKVNYINNSTKVCIICSEHGEFWQTPDAHINGNQGCPACKESKLEKEIRLFLNENNIEYIQRKTFVWLKKERLLHYDFYLPKYKVAIECQGLQHFKSVNYFGGIEKLKKQQEYDLFKKIKSKEHGIKLLYFANEQYSNEIITDKNNILTYIK